MSRLDDVHAIEQLLYRYAVAIDTRDLAALDAVFTPDAWLDMSVAGTLTPAEYRAKAATVLADLDATHHLLASPLVEVADDGTTATAHCYYQAQHVRNDCPGGPLLLIGGWIDDELVRTPEGWRITRRRGRAVWFDGNPAVLGLDVRVPGGRRPVD
ncbi:MAG TPA: nuclear transport factor 2 family protein [Acidimicrobiales bacterium]